MEPTSKYSGFTSPIRNGGKASFDVHVYFDGHSEHEVKFMKNTRQAIIEKFPELIVYDVHDRVIGPHPLPMFEVDLFSPAQFGAFIPWLAINHGPLSVLIHPNTGDSHLDHSQNAIWIGDKLDLNLDAFDKVEEMDEVARRLQDVVGKVTDGVEEH
ncbi:MAG: hypothetical protein Q9192_005581 [Flavoplaca navasiana]